jgi:hypothetical protein
MKKLYVLTIFSLTLLLSAGCEDVSDMAINRVVSPVVIDVSNTSSTEITATISELDKGGILDQNIGIVYKPVPDLSIEVFAGGSSLGMFTTDIDGKIIVGYNAIKPSEFAGTYKGIAFRIKK